MPGFSNNDSGLVFSIGCHIEVFSPSRKRSRITGPLTFSRKLKNTRPSIDLLPDECLLEIFRRLPSGQERSISACVSKRWLTILSSIRISEYSWSKNSEEHLINFDEIVNNDEDFMDEDIEVECDGWISRSVESRKAADLRLAAIAIGTSSRGGLGKLSIQGSNSFIGVSDNGLAAIARGCPSLRDLSLWSLPSISDAGLVEIARECHLLEKLDFCQLPSISDRSLSLIAKNCQRLNTLSIESCPKIGDNSLRAIAKFCPNLKSITILDCPLIGDCGISYLLSSPTCALTHVKLHALNFSDYSVAVIGCYGKAITNLVLSNLPNVRQRSLWAMAKAKGLQSLTSLTVASCGGMGDLSLEAVGRDIPNLKNLTIRKNYFLSDKGLVSFAKAANALESLHLEECDMITETGVFMVLSSAISNLKSFTLVKCMGINDASTEFPFVSPCKSLRCLFIRNCPGIGNKSLNVIWKLCPQLHHLDLNGLSKITDDGLFPLLHSPETALSKVSLSNCSNFSDEVVFLLSTLHGKTLKLLKLNGCCKITDTSLSAVAEKCPALNELDLSKCSISDTGVAALSNGVQLNLQVLSLSGCPIISNKSLAALEKLGKTLIGLNLQNCSSMSNASIELLSEKLWKCDLLY